MKTVLIVEDEKMIRQGIKTMIMRSGVPIETIMECNNGETALDYPARYSTGTDCFNLFFKNCNGRLS